MSLVEDLQKKTVFELKAYAKKNNIDIVGANTKNELLEVIFNFVPIEEFPKKKKDEEEIKKSTEKSKSGKTVAVYSTRNISWNGVGIINCGYNIVAKEDSEKWLTHKSVRLATPEEVASYYGKK